MSKMTDFQIKKIEQMDAEPGYAFDFLYVRYMG